MTRRAVKSLGPSNDDPPAVQLEMRAAEIEAWLMVDGLRIDELLTAERWGWGDRENRAENADDKPLGDPGLAQWEAGWLAREMSMLDDATAWAWDISRPLAEQLAETAADDAAADVLDVQADREEARSAENTAALVADLDARGPAYDAIMEADAEGDESDGAP